MEKLKEILQQLRNGTSIEEIVNNRKSECIKESKSISKGNPRQIDRKGKKRTIGINRAGKVIFGGMVSSSNDFIDEDRKVRIESGLADIVDIKTGNLDDTYAKLFEYLTRVDNNRLNIEEVSRLVSQIVNEYFGEKGDGSKRLDELLVADEGTSTLSDLKGKNLAACVERALLSQNLFKMLGIDATIKQSTIIRDEKSEGHAYNIIRDDGKNYIYDTSLPGLDKNGEKQPLVGTISDQEYMLLIDGLAQHGCQTEEMNNGIIYDSSFGTLEEELKRYSEEELQAFRKNAHLDKKIVITGEDIGRGTLKEQGDTWAKKEAENHINRIKESQKSKEGDITQ